MSLNNLRYYLVSKLTISIFNESRLIFINILGTYSQYRQTAVQPVRLLVEQGFEEPIGKPNASPRPSILRKREHDNSPIKGKLSKLFFLSVQCFYLKINFFM